ncbi:MAG: metallophosphoesterase family protein [Pseudomonadales bacterium]
MPLKIIHTADWQIGKPFKNFAGDQAARLRVQRIATVNTIAKLAVSRDVDAVLVAGDVFDSQAVSDDTLRRTINAMQAFSGDWVLLPGNHDAALAESVWTRLQRLAIVSANIHLALSPEPIDLRAGRLRILPAPLQRKQESKDLTHYFDADISGAEVFRIGLAHGSLENRLPPGAEQHNMIADDRCERARLDYMALGDWHGVLEIGEASWYAGTPEPDRFRNNQSGNVVLVELTKPGAKPAVEIVPVGHFHWQELEAEINIAADLDVLAGRLAQLGEAARQVVRLRLSGAVDMCNRAELMQLVDDWRARFHYLDLNLTELHAKPSAEDIQQLASSGFVADALEQLLRVQDDSSDPDHEYVEPAIELLYQEFDR